MTPLTHRDRRVPRTAGALPDWTPLGPFATWRIGLRPQEYGDRVEWHTLTSIRLEFWVQSQGFSIH